MSELNAALALLQADLPRIHKADTATVPTKAGGSYSYSYSSLTDVSEALLPLLAKHGLAFVAMPTFTDTGAFVLRFELRHTGGESITGEWPLPVGGTPQQQGSAVSYARRYCLLAVTGAAPDDDDDGAAASATEKPRTAKAPTEKRSQSAKPSQSAQGPSKASGPPTCQRCGEPITGPVVKADGGWAHKGDCP